MVLRKTRRGWEEIAPVLCSNGHRLKRNCLVGTMHCDCQVLHRTHTCKTCGDTIYTPPTTRTCRHRELDGRS